MKDFSRHIDFYIGKYDLEKSIFELGKKISNRGWIRRDEFLSICLWKSRRPKNLYTQNTSETIKRKTNLCFKEKEEKEKISLLTELKGVSIPIASAILSVTNPKNYPIIDERCVQSLKYLGYIEWTTITKSNWLEYLRIVRQLAEKCGKTARELEKGLFAYNRIKLDQKFKNLYKQTQWTKR